MAPDPAGDGAEAGPLTSATPALPGRSPKPRISYSIEYATTRLRGTRIFFVGVRKYHYPPVSLARSGQKIVSDQETFGP